MLATAVAASAVVAGVSATPALALQNDCYVPPLSGCSGWYGVAPSNPGIYSGLYTSSEGAFAWNENTSAWYTKWQEIPTLATRQYGSDPRWKQFYTFYGYHHNRCGNASSVNLGMRCGHYFN